MPWRRARTIFAYILLGALATGVGMGIVLYHARQDRDALQGQVAAANARIDALVAEHTKLIAEATTQVNQAEDNRKNIQANFDAMQRFQQQWNEARVLPVPDARTLRTWKSVLSLDLGISVHTPSFAPAVATDQTLTATINGNAYTAGTLWFSVARYRPEGEASLNAQLASTSTVDYRLGTRLLRGTRGQFTNDRSTAYVFRVEEQGRPSYLIWIRTVAPLTEPRLLEILSTLTFAS